MDECAALKSYIADSDRNLWFALRMSLEWDEASFRRMVQVLVDCLKETEGQEMVPRTLANMFVSQVPSTIAMMRRPDFPARNTHGRSIEEATAYFAKRIDVLKSLSLWFTDGRAAVQDERLRVTDWCPSE